MKNVVVVGWDNVGMELIEIESDDEFWLKLA
jgi:hypothetical protein